VDEDPDTREAVEWGLARFGIGVLTVASGAEALGFVASQAVHCLIVESRLPDMKGTDLIRALGHEAPPCFLIGRALHVRDVVEAVRLGARDVVEKPFEADELISRMVQSAVLPQVSPNRRAEVLARDAAGTNHGSVAARWVAHVMTLVNATEDSKTLAAWARLVGVSYSSLCETCRLIHIKPLAGRDFSRVLRSLVHRNRHQCSPEVLLDVSDRRTLAHLIQRCGAASIEEFQALTVSAFFERQKFIPPDHEAVKLLRRALQNTLG